VIASVIVVSHAGRSHLADSLPPLRTYGERGDVEVVVVDNGSADDCSSWLATAFPWVRTVRARRNLGFAGGVALGAEAARGEVLVLINDDAAAQEGLVEAHLEALAAHPTAAAAGGRLVSWDGTRHDFARGVVTFDAHAFQVGQGRPVDELVILQEGEPLAFACGGNMAVRASDWRACGGFDRDLFAYFEDVDLGWRLWAMGREVVAAPAAVARHRGAATSSALGDFRRGVLFERNALRTFFANADDELRQALGAAVLATFLHRLVAFAGAGHDLAAALADPFGGQPAPVSRKERWRRRLQDGGPGKVLRHLLARLVLGPRAGRPVLDEGHLVMQLQAADGFFAGLDRTEERRRDLEKVRARSDREILERFPRVVVPTYDGDAEWFESAWFRSLLPEGWPLRRMDIDELLDPSILG